MKKFLLVSVKAMSIVCAISSSVKGNNFAKRQHNIPSSVALVHCEFYNFMYYNYCLPVLLP